MLLERWPPHTDISMSDGVRGCGAGGVVMAIGMTEWLIIAAVIVLLFGRGKVSELMGDIGRGITSFRRGLSEPAEGPAAAGRASAAPARAAGGES